MLDETKNDISTAKSISGLFIDGETARQAVNLLTEMGYNNDEINVIVTDNAYGSYFQKPDLTDAASETQQETKAGPAGATMASIGAVLGAATAIGVTIATAGGALILIGPMAAGGAALGAGVGGLFGGLLGSSVSAEERTFFEQGVHEGRILIQVNTHSLEDWKRIRDEWGVLGGEFGSNSTQGRDTMNAA
jgi:hypothetical protein